MRIYCSKDTGFIEFFLTQKGEANYAEYRGDNDEVTIFYSERTKDVIGYAIEDIDHLSLIDLSLEDKLAIVIKWFRKVQGMTQQEFVEYLNAQAQNEFVSLRNYQRIESSYESGNIGIHFLSTLYKIFPDLNWSILLPSKSACA